MSRPPFDRDYLETRQTLKSLERAATELASALDARPGFMLGREIKGAMTRVDAALKLARRAFDDVRLEGAAQEALL